MMTRLLSPGDLLQLQRLTTPTVYNGWEQITRRDRREYTNLDETHDYMPDLGPMVGYAVTVVCQPSRPQDPESGRVAWAEYREYVASVPGPKIVVLQDLDKPRFIGSFWGEVNATFHRALGCVGTITDGPVRDVDEMRGQGFKALASRLCVGHAYSTPVRWDCEVDAFGCKITPGTLIHADQHGFLMIPEEDQGRLLEAALFMDANECNTVIAVGRGASGQSTDEIVQAMKRAAQEFDDAAQQKFGRTGEW
jgi:4-hydroxy-4-methyl-2-oxoglutarate aldolase